MSNTLPFNTQAVITTRSGTDWTVDVSAANLDANLKLKDFVVLFDNVVQTNTNFVKNTPTSLQYLGPSLGAPTTVEVRRKTPLNPIKNVRFGERFASDDWNRELNRLSRRAAEYETFGIGSLGNVSGVPLNAAYDTSWAGDTIYAPTRQAIYNKIENVVSNAQAADTAILANFANYAPLNNAALTGTPTAPTPPPTANNKQLQTTEGVRNFLSSTEPKTLANTALNATPPSITNNTSLATTAFAHLASVTKRFSTAVAAGPVTVNNGAGYVTLVSISVTPRSSNSSFLVFFYANMLTTNPNIVNQIRLRAGVSNIFAASVHWFGGADADIGTTSLMGVFSPGVVTPLTITAEASTQNAPSAYTVFGPDATFGVDASNAAGTRSCIVVLEFENVL